MKWANSRIEIIFLLIVVFYLCYLLSSILIPLVFAFLFAALFQPFISYLRNKKFPNWLIFPAIAFITLSIIFCVILIFSTTISEFINQKDFLVSSLREKIKPAFALMNELSKKYLNSEINIDDSVSSILTSDFLSKTIGSVFNTLGDFTSSFLVFAFYYVVFLVSMPSYKNFLKYVAGEYNEEQIILSYEKILQSIYTYVKLKIFVSFFTALFVFIVLVIFGVKFAFLWSFLTFVLNFIPIIGSLVAVILPALMGVIQFDSYSTAIILLIILVSGQMIFGNIVEPVLMGSGLSLNTITTMFGLVFWGFLWGASGMLLSVPLVVMFKLIMEQIPELGAMGRILGTPGKNSIK